LYPFRGSVSAVYWQYYSTRFFPSESRKKRSHRHLPLNRLQLIGRFGDVYYG
jgi:hypothetical protein